MAEPSPQNKLPPWQRIKDFVRHRNQSFWGWVELAVWASVLVPLGLLLFSLFFSFLIFLIVWVILELVQGPMIDRETLVIWWATTVFRLGGGLLLLGGLWVAYIRSEASRHADAITGIKAEQEKRRKAFSDQLAAVKQTEEGEEPHIELRTEGLFGLERLMKEAPEEYHHQILIRLCVYLRENAKKAPEDPKAEHTVTALREDVHTCLQIIARRKVQDGEKRIGLNRLNFYDCQLGAAKFAKAHLSGTYFKGAALEGADFTGAWLLGADFTWADLRGADFTGADFTWAGEVDFKGAIAGSKFLECPSPYQIAASLR